MWNPSEISTRPQVRGGGQHPALAWQQSSLRSSYVERRNLTMWDRLAVQPELCWRS